MKWPAASVTVAAPVEIVFVGRKIDLVQIASLFVAENVRMEATLHHLGIKSVMV